MKIKLLLLSLLWSGLVISHAGTSVTIVTKAPIEQIAPDGSVTGVSMATPGTHYTLVRYSPNGPEGQPVVILSDGQNQQYKIAANATDYTPSPVTTPTSSATNLAASAAPAPSAPSPSANAPDATPQDTATLTQFLDQTGLTIRYKYIFNRAATAKIRPLENTADVQNFLAAFNTPEKQHQYDTIIMDTVRKEYAQFSADDLTAINSFLQSPLGNTYAAPNSPGRMPGSVADLFNQATTPEAHQAAGIVEVHTQETLQFLQFGKVAYHNTQAIPQAINNGELEGLADGILSAPTYADRADEVKALLQKDKALTANIAFQQIDAQITQNGDHPISNPDELQRQEEHTLLRTVERQYINTLSPDQITEWQKFATSPAGQKLYQFRFDCLTKMSDTIALELHDQRYASVKAWASANPDDAFKALQNIATITPVSSALSPSDVR